MLPGAAGTPVASAAVLAAVDALISSDVAGAARDVVLQTKAAAAASVMTSVFGLSDMVRLFAWRGACSKFRQTTMRAAKPVPGTRGCDVGSVVPLFVYN